MDEYVWYLGFWRKEVFQVITTLSWVGTERGENVSSFDRFV